MVYFEERPKEKRSDLYDRDEELEELKRHIEGKAPLVLLLGLRRTGKTSLLKVALNEVKLPSILVDCRIFEERVAFSASELLRHIEHGVSTLLGRWRSIVDYLKGVEGISIYGLKVRFSWSKREKLSFADLLTALDEWASSEGRSVIVAFDEGQELAKLRGMKVLPVFAYAYDNLRHITIVLTGSKIGLLYRFLRVKDAESPLYGRVRREVLLHNFTREQSLDFLERGFEQFKMKPSHEILEHAVEKLDGVVGWLTYFGVIAVTKGLSMKTVEETLIEGSKLALKELEHFLSLRAIARRRYLAILTRIAEEPASWSEVKRYLEAVEGAISDSDFTMLLRNLLDAGFIEKVEGNYRVSDPVLRYALIKRRGLLA